MNEMFRVVDAQVGGKPVRSYDQIVDQCCDAWNKLSVTSTQSDAEPN